MLNHKDIFLREAMLKAGDRDGDCMIEGGGGSVYVPMDGREEPLRQVIGADGLERYTEETFRGFSENNYALDFHLDIHVDETQATSIYPPEELCECYGLAGGMPDEDSPTLGATCSLILRRWR